MKKVLVFMSIFAFVLGLAACKEDVDPADAENIADALQKLSLNVDALAVTDDIELPTTGLHDVTITWSSDNTDVIANDGTVTRPAVGEDDVTVKLTATITLGDLEETKEFTFKVKAEVPSLAVTMPEFLGETVAVGDVVELTGIVIGVIPDAGYHLYADGVATYVYVGEAFDAVVGDEVTAKGAKTIYYNLVELEDVQSQTINSSGNTVPAAAATTLEDIYAESNTDSQFYNMWVTFDGYVHEVAAGEYSNLWISWYDADLNYNGVMVYYNSGSTVGMDALDALIGHKVTAEVIVKDYHSQGYWRVNVAKDAAATDLGAITDQDKANLAAAMVEFTGLDALISNLTLPAGNEDFGATFAWASDNEAAVTSAGVVMAVAGSEGTATLTLTATVGTATATKTFDCTVMDLNDAMPTSVDEALDAPDDSYVIVTGVVTGFYYDNPFIQDADGTAIVVEDMEGMVMVGDEIVVSGFIATDDYYDERRLIEDAVLQEVVSSGNELFAITDADDTIVVADNSLDITNKLYTMELTVANNPTANAGDNDLIDTYGYVFFQGDGTTYLTMKAEDFMPGFETMYVDGDKVTLTFIMSDVHYDNIRMAAVTPPMQEFAAYGWTMTEADGVYTFDYADTPAAWWNNNAQLGLWPLSEYTTSIDFTFTGVLDHEYLFKIEGGGAAYEEAVMGTGAEQTFSLSLASFTEEQLAGLNLIVVFVKTETATGSLAISAVEFVEELPTPDWVAYGWTMVQTEDAYIFGYSGITSEFWNTNAQFAVETALTGTEDAVVFTFMGEEGQDYLFKIEGGGVNNEVAVTATGEMQMHTVPLTGFTEAEIQGLNLIVLFATTVDGAGNISVYDVEFTFPAWMGYGVTLTDDGSTITIDYADTPASWWNNNAQWSLDPLAANTEGIEFTFTGVAGVEYLFKIEGDGAYEEAVVATGSEETFLLSLDSFTAAQIPNLDLVVVFVKTEAATGTLTISNIELVMGPDLFISEVIEGGGNNKAIEIYNPTGAEVDLSGYSIIENYGSGTNTYALTGTLAAGEVLVICTDAIDTGTNLETNCDIQLSYPSVSHFNGNDTLQLLHGEMVIDQFGVEADAGGADFAKDVTLVRNPDVMTGSTTFDMAEWTSYAKDTYDYIGAHTVN